MKEYFKKNGLCTVPEDMDGLCCYAEIDYKTMGCKFQSEAMTCSCVTKEGSIPKKETWEAPRTCSVSLSSEAKQFIEDNINADT